MSVQLPTVKVPRAVLPGWARDLTYIRRSWFADVSDRFTQLIEPLPVHPALTISTEPGAVQYVQPATRDPRWRAPWGPHSLLLMSAHLLLKRQVAARHEHEWAERRGIATRSPRAPQGAQGPTHSSASSLIVQIADR